MTERLKFGLVGCHIQYSRSPELFQAIFDMTKTVGEFKLYDLSHAEFGRRFGEIANSGIDALAVTIPYKMEVVQHMDNLGDTAGAVGAVNSIHLKGGRMTGYNTDSHGFAGALRLFADRLPQAKALVLGCGGAARAVVYSLANDFDIQAVTVMSRLPEKADEFKRIMSDSTGNSVMHLAAFAELSNIRDTADFELIVNCTPVGGGNMKDACPLPADFSWPEGKIYYDLNYGGQIPAIARADEAGLSTIDGRQMLVAQALKSFELWTGRKVPFDPVFERVFGNQ